MDHLSKLFMAALIVMFFIAGVACINGSEKSSSGYEITWVGTPPAESAMIETMINQQISPYPGMEYDNITLSASRENEKLRIHAIAESSGSRYPDIYDFTYRDDDLIRVGYLLEAIPESVRSEAIDVAMQSESIANTLGSGTNAYGVSSVKRILPETSEKFHARKTLISVTWLDHSISALVDMDTREVVQVWNGQ
ncbi:hypothetical protein [Methanococcoides burtonii]|uniref:Uncharacterized protein n=1 Tax=Methanococcoides burtonii (strain DSM 6242 / NBRC 107633 / OCM 468 / ACE-M) TaxID=259564 RepID=Q12Y35_METBU|nr:hypothetical protein [Methanococcoides burtonii]ABE51641.1 Hypothetical protein Mbur_0672 [Methanococcoides burtonii DSM 6242]